MEQESVLIVEDRPLEREATRRFAEGMGLRVETCGDADEARARLESGLGFDFALVDLYLDRNLDERTGLALITDMRQCAPKMAVIAVSADPRPSTWHEAQRAGADLCLRKPILSSEELAVAIETVSQKRWFAESGVNAFNAETFPQSLQREFPEGLVLDSATLSLVAKVASQPSVPLVVCGEGGSGRDEIAKLLHRLRLRSGAPSVPFVKVDCAHASAEALGRRLFGFVPSRVGTDNNATFGALSIAQGGILYLDNLDRMPVEFQEEFARVLADGSYDRRGDGKAMVSNFQLVASLPAPLDKVMGDGGVCPALRGRLMGVEIRLLPLRMRSFEIKPIIKIFFARRGQTPSEQVVGELADFCKRYYWQGNIRELFSYLELVTLLHDDALSRLDFSCMPTVASMFPPPEAGETAIDARTSTRAAVASAELSDEKAAATVHGGTWREVVSQAAPSSSAANASDPRPVGAAQAKTAAHSALHLLSDALARDVPIYDVLAFVEKEILSEAIRRHGMNMSHVCAALRMPRSTLNLKRRHYGLP